MTRLRRLTRRTPRTPRTPRIPRTPKVVAIVVCTIALVLSGCSGSDDDAPVDPPSSAAPATSEPPQPPRRPRVGDCHRLSWDQALSPTAESTRVACRRKHTSVTFHVGRIQRDRAGAPLPVDAARVQQQVARVCPQRLPDFLGGTVDEVRRSLLRAVWFTPTLAEAEAGADWFRCDVVATGGRRTLSLLPPRVRGVLTEEDLKERFALCATGEPGTGSFSRVPCAAPHTWRAVTTVDVGGDVYPGREAVETSMEDTCSDAATEVASNPLDVRWSQEAPTRQQWRAGQRHGFCWVPE